MSRHGNYHDLSEPMREALSFARDSGGTLYAGRNVIRGRSLVVNARTLDGLASRGLVTLSVSPDGGMMATVCASPISLY